LPGKRSLALLVSAATALLVASLHSTPAGDGVVVRRVIDGDTIRLETGELVRYIGVDAPEVRRRVGDRWVEDPEPFGREAAEANRRWVEGKRVRLEYDVQRRDRYGRVLAYVYVAGGMINAKLLEEGFAKLLTIPPNVKYVDQFRQAVQAARDNRRGVWNDTDRR
jgi:micrococcal nuclease